MTSIVANLRMHVQKLASEIGERNVFCPRALSEAARYITEEWRLQGYDIQRQLYEVRGARCENLEVTRWGQSQAQEILLIGAHYDSVSGSPGADDNASGVAALLEIARLFTSIRTRRTVRFVAFVNEEPPFFYWSQMGSMVYARAARARSDDIRLMMSLEMLGYYDQRPGSQQYPPLFRLFYPNRANFIAFVSNLRSRRLMRQAVTAFRASSDFAIEHVATLGVIPGISLSDHQSFWRQGYRAMMVTDTAFYRYPYYHTAWDTPDKLDFETFARVTEGLCKTIEALAGPAAVDAGQQAVSAV